MKRRGRYRTGATEWLKGLLGGTVGGDRVFWIAVYQGEWCRRPPDAVEKGSEFQHGGKLRHTVP